MGTWYHSAGFLPAPPHSKRMGRVSLLVGPFPPLGGGVEQEASRFELGRSLFMFFILFFIAATLSSISFFSSIRLRSDS